ncbi:carbohydrate binding family 9 domain-containing protein [Segetibacter koreensis]|uniref:carbohydrate binding family 9 domain-containing protein n=1 Tax=Segetibacter koreensis TaxID=398037 RepID=UPI000365859B|nr:carbohydrate binding family 9 domain-containing protein [Segetibacter koreensis]
MKKCFTLCSFIKIVFVLFFVFLNYFSLKAQKKNEQFQIHVTRASSPVKVDGIMDEETWRNAEVAKNFYMVLPMDTGSAKAHTEVRMAYDDHNLYLIAECFQSVPGPNYVESLRNDWVFGKNDNFLMFMDPFDDQTNGFAFGTNSAGAQWDGMMYGGGSVDLNWDNKWVSAVKNYNDKWILELAIPFKSIRYKKGITRWGINFSRLDLKTSEKSSWAPVPRQFPTASLAYSGILIWDQPPPTAGSNVSLIPYALGGFTRNHEENKPANYRKDIGVDAKIALTSSLNLDLTVNPDFSQVEVDKQVTNLDRYELFFPEKRQFFLENGDLFANFGYASIRPFFSRRIGLGVPIQFGARLSGKPDKNWRLGVMDMQTGSVDNTGLPAQNFTVAAVQRRVFSRSNIGLIFINKQSLNYSPGKDTTKPVYSDYNRTIGLEYNLASPNNKYTGKAMFLKSFSPGRSGDDIVHAAHIQYLGRKLLLFWQHEYVGKNYNAEVGYVPRQGYIKLNPQVGYTFFPSGGMVLSHGPSVMYYSYFNTSFKKTDDEGVFNYLTTFRKGSTFSAWVSHDYVKLLQPFDPTNFTKDTLARGTKHSWNAWGTQFVSMPQSVFTYGFSTRYGGYYENGTRLNLTADLGYRFQPYVSIAMSTSYNNIKLPQPWGNRSFWLIGPRVDVTMTNKLFFTTFVQYNDQQKNINLNTRLQWRYKPASDLFFVYTDNYYPAPFSVRNRAMVLKWTYWWNL